MPEILVNKVSTDSLSVGICFSPFLLHDIFVSDERFKQLLCFVVVVTGNLL